MQNTIEPTPTPEEEHTEVKAKKTAPPKPKRKSTKAARKVSTESVNDILKAFPYHPDWIEVELEILKDVRLKLHGDPESLHDHSLIIGQMFKHPSYEEWLDRDRKACRENIGYSVRNIEAALLQLDHHLYPRVVLRAAIARIRPISDQLKKLQPFQESLPNLVKRLDPVDLFVFKLYSELAKVSRHWYFDLSANMLPPSTIDTKAILKKRPDLRPLTELYTIAANVNAELAEVGL